MRQIKAVSYKSILSAGVLAGILIIASTAVSGSGNPPATPTPSIPAFAEISPDVATAASCTTLANWQCVETRPGLSLCRANNICVVKVDLNNNALRPRVVIAPGGGTAWLSDMASGAGALAAINGDYFSGCPDTVPPLNCGEGLTYVDGVDYTDYTGSEWQNRRSLGFNDNYDPNIGWPGEQGGYHRYLLGGGPQVTFGGEYRWRCWYQSYNTEGNCACQNNTVVINDELFGCSANNWWNRPQTFIGFSDDRNTLYLAVSEPGYNKTPHEMHDVLWVLGARYSLKMDGGGSSGMYFNDGGYSFAWNGSRAVANAWVIVPSSAPPPSCDATSLPSGYVKCADENGYCSFSGTQQVYYGADSCFRVRSFTDGVGCNNSNFGDPLPGVPKACYIPASCNPTADQVALYANTNYGGACVTLNIGEYPNPGYLGPVGNDNTESIRVGSNVQAVLCEHDNYQGRCETFTGDDPNLGDNTIGANVVSSVKVQNRPQPRPDLVPSRWGGWEYPIVPSSVKNTTTVNTLYADHPTYVDWGVSNSGNADAGADVYGELYLDGTRLARYNFGNVQAGWTWAFFDWQITVSSGWHTLRFVADPDNLVAESDEGNNTWERAFYWNPVTGWWGEYYNNLTLSDSPVLVRDDPAINFSWAYDSPGPGVNADNFSVRWTRSLAFAPGIYEFALTHDDGARLWVDNALVLDQWGTCCRTDRARVFLSSGFHALRVEMFDSGGAAVAQLGWEKVSRQVYLPLVLRRHP
jgi:hypothetical protein